VNMENTANVGLFAVHRIFFKYAERIYAYVEKTQRDSKLSKRHKSAYISVNNDTNFKQTYILSIYTTVCVYGID
jgi:hypothetical protein